MDKQEAIERIKQNKAAAEFYAQKIGKYRSAENELKDIEAFDMAIEALQKDIERHENTEFLISRYDVKDKAKEINEMANNILANFPSYEEVVSVVKCIERCSRGKCKDDHEDFVKKGETI